MSSPNSGAEPLMFSAPEVTKEDIDAVVGVLESGWLTTGNEAQMLEVELADYLDVDHVITTSSCTTAEEIVLAWHDLAPGTRVIVPSWTFVSTALAVERLGCVPLIVDVDPTTLNMCPQALARALEVPNVGAVVGVHYAGTPVSEEIHTLCGDAGIPFVEDAAHALGSHDHRGMISGRGSAGACFSFYATKNLTTAEGGAIGTDNADLADFSRQYRLHGMSRDAVNRYAKPGAHSYDVTMPGLKANMPDVLAALGRSQLRRFEKSQAHRRRLVERYRSNLADADLAFVPLEHDERSADHLLVIDAGSADRRGDMIEALTSDGIGASVHFRPLHTFSWYADRPELIGPGGLPVADKYDGRVMSLPLHVNMNCDDVDRVCEKATSPL